jgi:hypothetical protein
MEVTVLGIILVPLSLLWALNPVRLLQTIMISAVFEASAAVVIGGFGLQPAMVPGLLFIAYIVVQYAIGMRYPGEGAVLKAAFPLLALLCYAVLSAKLLPDAFAGQIMVWPQKQDILAPGAVPLEFNFGNVTQTLYLSTDIILTVVVAIFVTRQSIPYEKIIGAYMTGGYIVVFILFWEFANSVAGVPYPAELLKSNPGLAIVSQTIGSVSRMEGPFSEPSALAFYLSGVALCSLWLSVRGYRYKRPNLLLALSIVCVLLSTSTTGILTLAIGLPLVLAKASTGGDPAALGRIGKTIGFLVLGGLLVVTPVLILKPSLVDAVSAVVDSTLTKGQSESFDERSAADMAALDSVVDTYGLGVGWGSYRSSSLVPGILANSGVFGAAMVLWMIVCIFRLGARGRAGSADHPAQMLADGFIASMCGQVAAAVIAAPMIISLIFYVQLGCVIGALSRIASDRQPIGGRRSYRP